ncbi:MAG: hypothetical protein P4L33_16810 [Capsulimonadaceae bacterium]|nr:hypothetical protein [Capsulimonadaceae bacterium]
MKLDLRGGRSGRPHADAMGLALATAALVLTCANGYCATTPPAQKASDFDYSYQSGSPTAEALGGSYLLSLKGPEAGAANPSQVNNDLQPSISVGAVVSDSNINVNNAQNLINQLSNLNDSSKSSSGISAANSAFNDVWNYAGSAGAAVNPIGTYKNPGSLSVRIDPVIGASLGGRWALIGESNVQAVANIYRNQTGSTKQLSVGGGAVGLTSAGVAFATPVNKITYGLYPKILRADYVGYAYSIDDQGGTPSRTNVPYEGKQTVDLDAGASMNVLPDTLDASVVVRHLFFPSLSVESGDTIKLNPEVDFGVHAKYYGLDGYAEAHNLTASNVGNSGAGVTDHLGLQKTLVNTLALRAGFDDGKFVYGVGLHLFVINVDFAAGSSIDQRVGLSASFKI